MSCGYVAPGALLTVRPTTRTCPRKHGSDRQVRRVVCRSTPPSAKSEPQPGNQAAEDDDDEYIIEPESSVQRRRIQAMALGLLNLFHLFAGFNSVISLLVPMEFFGFEAYSYERLFVRFWGSAALLRIAAVQSLKKAAENNRLESATYKRLSSALAVCSLLAALFTVTSGVQVYSAHVAAYFLLNLFTGIVCAWVWLATPETGLVSMLDGVLSTPGSLFAAKKMQSRIFGVLSILNFLLLACGVLAPAYAASAAYGIGMTPIVKLLLQGAATTFGLQAAALLTLKDASERDRLDASTFKMLNTGLAGSNILLYLTSLVSSRGKPALGAVILAAVNIITGAVTTYHWIRLRARDKQSK